ncbi:MAG: phosphoglucosamine mutase [Methanomassiliicoccales archaeon]
MSLFGSSGIRGVVGKDIDPMLAVRIGAAVGTEYQRVVTGKDTRTTGDVLLSALVSGLTSVGAEVHHAGTVSTPTLARASSRFDCGLMVTASHNPPEYNGVKMWNPDGSAFSEAQARRIEGLVEDGGYSFSPWRGAGRFHRLSGAEEEHLSAVLDRVGSATVKVVVDPGCGAGFRITPLLLRKMGCRVISLNAQADGFFPGRPPEPSEENLGDLMETVRSTGADLGIAHDGDADRVVAIDSAGSYVGGDRLLALFASLHPEVVTPINASMVLDDMTRVIRTRVGDAFVSQTMREEGVDFGGEPSGTFIFSRHGYFPDGVHAAALLARMVSERSLEEMVEGVPSYPMARRSFPLHPSDRGRVMDMMEEEMGTLECQRLLDLDGYRAEFDEGWLLLRPSGTEPKLRMTVEARSEGSLSSLIALGESIARRCLG